MFRDYYGKQLSFLVKSIGGIPLFIIVIKHIIPMKPPLLYKISLIISLLMSLFLVSLLSELIIFLTFNPYELVLQMTENPLMVLIMVPGFFIFLYTLYINLVQLIFSKNMTRRIYQIYLTLIVMLFILITYLIILNGEISIIVLNIFFIPIYLQLGIMRYHGDTKLYIESLNKPISE